MSAPSVYPHVTLASASELAEAIQATLFLPTALDGYYRSSRFDWGTMLGDVRSGRRRAFCSNVGLAPLPSLTGAHETRLGACMSPVGLTPSGQWRTARPL